MTCMDQ